MLNINNGRTLRFMPEAEIRYANIVSGGEGFSMTVRLTSGAHDRVEPPSIADRNKPRTYPIKGVPDDILGVAYRPGLKVWIDTVVRP